MSQILSKLLLFIITKPLSESVIVIFSCFTSTRVKRYQLKTQSYYYNIYDFR